MTALLLDVNALLALGWAEHEAHDAVVECLGLATPWATCSITQLGFVRISATSGIFSRTLAPSQAHAVLATLCADPHHHFVATDLSVTEADFSQLSGPRQTTDAYLLALAQHHQMRLLTFDRRLAQAFPGPGLELLTAT